MHNPTENIQDSNTNTRKHSRSKRMPKNSDNPGKANRRRWTRTQHHRDNHRWTQKNLLRNQQPRTGKQNRWSSNRTGRQNQKQDLELKSQVSKSKSTHKSTHTNMHAPTGTRTYLHMHVPAHARTLIVTNQPTRRKTTSYSNKNR